MVDNSCVFVQSYKKKMPRFKAIQTKMCVLLCVFLFVLYKTGEGKNYEDYEAYDRLRKNIDVFPEHFSEPVPFGHITREGFGDPFSPKQPRDDLELRLISPKNKQEAIDILLKRKPRILFSNPKMAKSFLNPHPKDQWLIERIMEPPPETNETSLKWYDLTMQDKKLMMLPKNQYIPKRKSITAPVHLAPPRDINELKKFFSKTTFELADDKPELQMNWTTCDEFAVGAVFSPKDIVNLKWTPFYVWDANMHINIAREHTFEFPSNKLVKEYYSKYSRLLNKTIDWSNSKLLMKGIAETLLIAADKRGLYHAIARHELPSFASTIPIQLPLNTLRMKIEDPYLVMTFCENYYATVMAISGNGPTNADEMEAEAATLKLKGPGRPIWRDYEWEKRSIQAMNEAKLREENDKFIVVDETRPPKPIGRLD